MPDTVKLEATDGPSIWGLLVDSLGHGRYQRFTFKEWGEQVVQILRVGSDLDSKPKDGHYTDFWVEGKILGDLLKSDKRLTRFYGKYSTETKNGTFEAVTDLRPLWQIEAEWNK